MAADSEWASLPLPAVFLVLDKLPELIDHVFFTAVCKEWGSLARDYHSTQRWHKNRPLPMLLIPVGQSGVAIYIVSHGNVYWLGNNIQFPTSNKQRQWFGCGYGCLAILSSKRLQDPRRQCERTITLINPFSKAKQEPSIISLPSMIHQNLSSTSIYPIKVFLSHDPALNPDNYAVVALLPGNYRVAFKKGGENNWTMLDTLSDQFTDAIFYKDQIYLAGIPKLVSFNLDSELKFTPLLRILPRGIGRAYLVESVKCDLWYVARLFRRRNGCYNMTTGFKVYKLVSDGSIMQAVELKSIGDEALFLGGNQSVSVLSSQFRGCQPNSIYYTDDFSHDYNCGVLSDHKKRSPAPCDMGIFNLEDETITRHYTENSRAYARPTPVWITPVFNGL